MLQTALPFFDGVTQITALLAFRNQDGHITYFNGALPVFAHKSDDMDSFRMTPVLRRNVQKALNRGEAYHQLRRAIAYAHDGRFRARSKHEQEVWNECARLVANAVVYYNALILSEALAELERRGDLAFTEILTRVSPVAWQHINVYGRYLFHEDFTPIEPGKASRAVLDRGGVEALCYRLITSADFWRSWPKIAKGVPGVVKGREFALAGLLRFD